MNEASYFEFFSKTGKAKIYKNRGFSLQLLFVSLAIVLNQLDVSLKLSKTDLPVGVKGKF